MAEVTLTNYGIQRTVWKVPVTKFCAKVGDLGPQTPRVSHTTTKFWSHA